MTSNNIQYHPVLKLQGEKGPTHGSRSRWRWVTSTAALPVVPVIGLLLSRHRRDRTLETMPKDDGERAPGPLGIAWVAALAACVVTQVARHHTPRAWRPCRFPKAISNAGRTAPRLGCQDRSAGGSIKTIHWCRRLWCASILGSIGLSGASRTG